MWVSNRIFMELIERIVKAEQKVAAAEQKAAALEERVKGLEEKPFVSNVLDVSTRQRPGEVIVEPFLDKNKTENADASKLLDELLNGVPDETLGRVKYTNGRE